MTIEKIQEMLKTLLYYDNCEIVHKIRGEHHTFSLSYAKESHTFQLENIETKQIENYKDLESISLALLQIIKSGATKINTDP